MHVCVAVVAQQHYVHKALTYDYHFTVYECMCVCCGSGTAALCIYSVRQQHKPLHGVVKNFYTTIMHCTAAKLPERNNADIHIFNVPTFCGIIAVTSALLLHHNMGS